MSRIVVDNFRHSDEMVMYSCFCRTYSRCCTPLHRYITGGEQTTQDKSTMTTQVNKRIMRSVCLPPFLECNKTPTNRISKYLGLGHGCRNSGRWRSTWQASIPSDTSLNRNQVACTMLPRFCDHMALTVNLHEDIKARLKSRDQLLVVDTANVLSAFTQAC